MQSNDNSATNDAGIGTTAKERKQLEQEARLAQISLGYSDVDPAPIQAAWSQFLPTGPVDIGGTPQPPGWSGRSMSYTRPPRPLRTVVVMAATLLASTAGVALAPLAAADTSTTMHPCRTELHQPLGTATRPCLRRRTEASQRARAGTRLVMIDTAWT